MSALRKPRVTQRIPREQRKRPEITLTLGPEALAVLGALPKRTASAYVEQAVLELADRETSAAARRRRPAPDR